MINVSSNLTVVCIKLDESYHVTLNGKKIVLEISKC